MQAEAQRVIRVEKVMTTVAQIGDEGVEHQLNRKLAEVNAALIRISGEVDGLKRADVFEVASVLSLSESVAKLQLEAARVSEAQKAREQVSPTALAVLCLSSEQLTLIKGIDSKAAGLLNSNGIHSFSDIAALTADDVAELGRMLGDARRICREGWIEQAALLAAGTQTAFARRIRMGHFASVVAVPATAVPASRTAEIIDLGAERSMRAKKKRPARHSSAIRYSAIAASAAACLLVSFNGTDLIQELISALWVKGGCSNSLTALFSQCHLALLQ